MLMYRMYPNFHHKVGSSTVMKSNQQGIKSGSFRKNKRKVKLLSKNSRICLDQLRIEKS